MSFQQGFPPRPAQGLTLPSFPLTPSAVNQPVVSTPGRLTLPSFAAVPSLVTTQPAATRSLLLPSFGARPTIQLPSTTREVPLSKPPEFTAQTPVTMPVTTPFISQTTQVPTAMPDMLFKPRKSIQPSRVPALTETKAIAVPEIKTPIAQEGDLFKPRSVTVPSVVPSTTPEVKASLEIPAVVVPPSSYEIKSGPRKSIMEVFKEVTKYRDMLVTDLKLLTVDSKGIKNARTQPKAFFDYLGRFLSIFIKDPPDEKKIGTLPNIVSTMLGPKYQKTWVRAWTHSSAEPELNKNYESLEAIGDKALGKAFKFYLFRKDPNATPQELNEYESRYMSKEFQPAISDAFRMIEWVIVHKDIDPRDLERSFPGIKEDVYEAFCGALSIISDDIYPGFGDVNVSNFLIEFFSNITIDTRMSKGKGETKFIEYYDRVAGKLEGGVDNYIVATRDNSTRLWEVRIEPVNFREFVQKLQKVQGSGYRPIQLPLGIGKSGNKTAATNTAFDHALDTLAEHGVNEEWSKRYRTEMIINRIGRAEYDRALIKASEMKFPDSDVGQIIRFEFAKPRNMNVTDMTVIFLVGVDKNQKRVNIEAGIYRGQEKEEFLEKKVIEKFLARKSS